MLPNRRAFLDVIASIPAEGTSCMGDNGYNVLCGSIPSRPLLFQSYADHPRVLNTQLHSTAAGRYQLLERYFDAYKAKLGLTDFSPASQDQIALQQIKERRALDLVDAGRLACALSLCNTIWASLPGAPYGQHTALYAQLEPVYLASGGVLEAA